MKKGKLNSWFRAFFLFAFLAFVGGGNSVYNKLNKLISDSEKSELVFESEEKSKSTDNYLKFSNDSGSALFQFANAASKSLFIHKLVFKDYVFVDPNTGLYLLYLSLKLDC